MSTAPVAGDLSVFGGSVVAAAPVMGDELLLAGSISMRAPVAGDLRAVGGSIDIEGPVAGDLAAFGFSVHSSSRTLGSSFVIAANIALFGGAGGPVTAYGNNVSLSGEFSGDVSIVAAGHISLAPDTVIRGKLSYQAPDVAAIPDSDRHRRHQLALYLPMPAPRALALTISVLPLRARRRRAYASLLAGLFPIAGGVDRAYVGRARRLADSTRLRTILVATPVLIARLRSRSWHQSRDCTHYIRPSLFAPLRWYLLGGVARRVEEDILARRDARHALSLSPCAVIGVLAASSYRLCRRRLLQIFLLRTRARSCHARVSRATLAV